MVLNINMYRESSDPNTGVIKFSHLDPHSMEKGPWHGLPVSTPYMTKDHLEMKRSKAQENNTTYVYDYPELFRINVVASWKEHITRYCMINVHKSRLAWTLTPLYLDNVLDE